MITSTQKTKWKIFIELTELHTFIGNIFLILIGITFSIILNHQFFLVHTLVYTSAIFCFHIFSNAYNNLKDYLHSSDKHDYRQKTSTIGKHQLPLSIVRRTCLISLLLFSLTSLYFLMVSTPWVILLGIIGFGVGIFYSSGPIPFNATFLGEVIGAGSMGFLVPLGALLVNQDQLGLFHLSIFIQFFFICLLPILTMFNCLLANNTCDLNEDILNGRKTLVYYLGTKTAIWLFQAITLFIFMFPIVLVYFHLLSKFCLLLLLYFPITWKKLKPYFLLPSKKETFPIVIHYMERSLHIYATLFFFSIFLN